jgi:hypothetical protein
MAKATIEIPENAQGLKKLINNIEKKLAEKNIDYSITHSCDGQMIKVRYNCFTYYPNQIHLL